jgi:hypothetical protein
MLSLLALCQRLAGSDLRADRRPKATHRKRGRLGDATLPAVRAPDKRQAMELRMVVSDAEPPRVMSALGRVRSPSGPAAQSHTSQNVVASEMRPYLPITPNQRVRVKPRKSQRTP